MTSWRRGPLAARALTVPFAAGLVVFALYPAIGLVALSLTRSTLGSPFQSWQGEAAYVKAFGDPRFTWALLRTTLYALVSTTGAMLLGVAVAFLLDAAVRGRALLRTLILLPLLTPPVTVGIVWQLLLMPQGGWINSALLDLGLITQPVSFLGAPLWAFPALCLADVWQWSPFVALLAYAALQTLPDEVAEAARIDGATGWATFRHVTLPMLAPTLLGVATLKLVIAFKVFDLVVVLTGGGPGQSTMLTSFQVYRTAIQQFDIGLAAAQTIVFALVVGLVTLPFTRAQAAAERRLS